MKPFDERDHYTRLAPRNERGLRQQMNAVGANGGAGNRKGTRGAGGRLEGGTNAGLNQGAGLLNGNGGAFGDAADRRRCRRDGGPGARSDYAFRAGL